MDYQEIIDIAHFINNVKLVIEPVKILLRRIFAVISVHSGIALLLKPFKMVSAVGHLKMRELGVAEFKIIIAPVGNYLRIFYRLGDVGEKLIHFLLAL